MVTVDGNSPFDLSIVSHIKDAQSNHIHFQNIFFDVKTIEDAAGRVYVRRRTGKWLLIEKHYKDDEQEFNYYENRCSECGASPLRDIGGGSVLSSFCPNCGAMLEGEST